MALNSKTKSSIIVLVMALAVIGLQKFGILNDRGPLSSPPRSSNHQKHNSGAPASNLSDATVLSQLRDKRLIYTKHGECRMKCRHISEAEIKAILQQGKINHRKSKPADYPCPSFAVEGDTKDGQEVRIVFAKCDKVTKVVTAIDLGKNYNCHCD